MSALGEEGWRIFVTVHLAWILYAPRRLRQGFISGNVGMAEISHKPFLLATVHPETNASNPAEPLNILISALAHFPDLPVLFTGPNSDPGGSLMRQALIAYVAETDNRWFVDSLEAAQYRTHYGMQQQ